MPARVSIFRSSLHARIPGLLLASMIVMPAMLQGQTVRTSVDPVHDAAGNSVAAPEIAAAELPEAPSAMSVAASTSSRASDRDGSAAGGVDFAEGAQQNPPGTPGSPLPRRVSHLDTIVAAGQTATPQSPRDKILGSMKDSISPYSIAGNVISASYSHLTNGSPNYGTDGTAFGERFGAAVARGASQNIFANGVMASVLHQDSRYYQLGSKYSILHRGVYAATRPLIGRTDSGKKIPNVALLTGYLGAAFLTRTYYPEKNQTISENFQTYGSSIGGAAIGFAVDEYLPQVLQALHLNRFGRNAP